MISYKKSSCAKTPFKRAYGNLEHAIGAAKKANSRHNMHLKIYKCNYCLKYHLTSSIK